MKALALCAALTACWLALASPPSVVAVPKSAPRQPTDVDALQGVWRQVTTAGAAAPAGLMLVIDGDRLTIRRDSDFAEEATFSLDSTASPKAINAEFDGGRSFGIYDLTGDTLRLCISEPGPRAVRPTTFQSFGQSVVALEFRRVMPGTR